MRNVLILFILALICTFMAAKTPVQADSPLTSTEFYRAYLDIPEVKDAEHAKLDDRIFAFLVNPANPIDQRVAVVNALGWNTEGTGNGKTFISLIAARLGKSPEKVRIGDLDPGELLLFGYIRALDDYFELAPVNKAGGELEAVDALTAVKRASQARPGDFVFQIIAALVKAQKHLSKETEWGKIYTEVDAVIEKNLDRNMRDDAVAFIMEYIGIYKEYVMKEDIKQASLSVRPSREYSCGGRVSGFALNGDETLLITRSGDYQQLKIWSVKTGKMVGSIDCGDFIDCCIFTPDGNWIVASDFSGRVGIYSAKSFEKSAELKLSVRVLGIAVNPSMTRAAFARFDGMVEIYGTDNWQRHHHFKAHDGYVSTVDYSADGRYLVTGSYDRSVKLWDLRHDYAPVCEKRNFKDGTFAHFISEDGSLLVRDFSGSIRVLECPSGRIRWERQLTGTIQGVASGPQGSVIAAASETGSIYLWDWKEGGSPYVFRAHRDQVMDVRFSKDGKRLFSASLDGTLKIWDAAALRRKL